jgi:uncharacterized protein (DUF1778 family)
MPKKAPGDVRSFILHVRFTAEQRDLLQSAAQEADRDLSDWVRRLVLKEAARIRERATGLAAKHLPAAIRKLHGQGEK